MCSAIAMLLGTVYLKKNHCACVCEGNCKRSTWSPFGVFSHFSRLLLAEALLHSSSSRWLLLSLGQLFFLWQLLQKDFGLEFLGRFLCWNFWKQMLLETSSLKFVFEPNASQLPKFLLLLPFRPSHLDSLFMLGSRFFLQENSIIFFCVTIMCVAPIKNSIFLFTLLGFCAICFSITLMCFNFSITLESLGVVLGRTFQDSFNRIHLRKRHPSLSCSWFF